MPPLDRENTHFPTQTLNLTPPLTSANNLPSTWHVNNSRNVSGTGSLVIAYPACLLQPKMVLKSWILAVCNCLCIQFFESDVLFEILLSIVDRFEFIVGSHHILVTVFFTFLAFVIN
jgi:hypothetical protein